ncbi:hypothetical protein LENIMA164B_20990 [Lelliottia nimipressuralis]
MVLAIRCHRQNMKTSIINGSEVSRLSVAIHVATRIDITTHSLWACTVLIHQPLKHSLIPSLRSGDFRKN